MTHEEFQQKIEAITNLDLAEKAHSALSKLCSSGGASFTMTVPPKLDDTDMILSEVIKRFELLHLESVLKMKDNLKTKVYDETKNPHLFSK